MEKFKEIITILSLFIIGFMGSVYILELAAYLLTLPNTIANVFGFCIYVITMATALFVAYVFVRSLIK